MSDFGLLIAIEVVDYLRTLRGREQEELLRQFRAIADFPSNYSDYAERDLVGRRIDVHVFRKYAIKFWTDFADRQVKILDLHPADRTG